MDRSPDDPSSEAPQRPSLMIEVLRRSNWVHVLLLLICIPGVLGTLLVRGWGGQELRTGGSWLRGALRPRAALLPWASGIAMLSWKRDAAHPDRADSLSWFFLAIWPSFAIFAEASGRAAGRGRVGGGLAARERPAHERHRVCDSLRAGVLWALLCPSRHACPGRAASLLLRLGRGADLVGLFAHARAAALGRRPDHHGRGAGHACTELCLDPARRAAAANAAALGELGRLRGRPARRRARGGGCDLLPAIRSGRATPTTTSADDGLALLRQSAEAQEDALEAKFAEFVQLVPAETHVRWCRNGALRMQGRTGGLWGRLGTEVRRDFEGLGGRFGSMLVPREMRICERFAERRFGQAWDESSPTTSRLAIASSRLRIEREEAAALARVVWDFEIECSSSASGGVAHGASRWTGFDGLGTPTVGSMANLAKLRSRRAEEPKPPTRAWSAGRWILRSSNGSETGTTRSASSP
jgi:hypothetical protein